VQDAWRPLSGLTVKAGLRYDRSTIENGVGEQIADMTLWQPRLGLAWDVAGDAKHVLRAAWAGSWTPGLGSRKAPACRAAAATR
jgi:outer membrane receptor protein involved in Fe transport